MLLLCISAYFVTGLLFTALYWMSMVVGKRHDEEHRSSQTDAVQKHTWFLNEGK
jgi:hypothetical protein